MQSFVSRDAVDQFELRMRAGKFILYSVAIVLKRLNLLNVNPDTSCRQNTYVSTLRSDIKLEM